MHGTYAAWTEFASMVFTGHCPGYAADFSHNVVGLQPVAAGIA